MYIRCDNCGWSQDDFWSEDYNPLRSLLDWEEYLLSEKLNQPFPNCENSKRLLNKTYKDVIISELERTAKKIKSMKWRTYEEFRADVKNGEAKCPQCGFNDKFITD